MSTFALAENTLLDKSSLKAIYLSEHDLKIAASILYNAYYDDPLFADIFQAEKDGYQSRLRSAIREELSAFWVAEQPMIGLFDNDRLLAVCCLTGPDAAFGAGRYWHWRLKMLLTAGLFGTRQMVEKEERVRASVPATDFHMISFIAVHPDYQHQGLGHVLLGAVDSILAEDSKSEGVAVLITREKQKHLFEDGHYEMVGELEVGHIQGSVMFQRK